ncbi:MAG: plastocyanin/azurin family copper-binding protein [Gemmatimonadales bacterium]|nr:plastocyanin/azurin family copper-binding protein [Gemmatimonadales bacterium]
MNALRLLLVACLSVALACVSERTGPSLNPGVGNCQVPLAVIDSGHVVVAINNFTFVQDTIVVPQGATVTWINCEPDETEPHTTTSDTAGVWGSPDLTTGARFSHTFGAAGEFPYHCEPHPFMMGKVVVQ